MRQRRILPKHGDASRIIRAREVLATLPPCAHVRRDGTRCRQPVRTDGTRCRFHTSGTGAPGLGTRAKIWRDRWHAIRAAPDELTATPVWQECQRLGLASARWRLVALAWPAFLSGDPGPWHAECEHVAMISADRARKALAQVALQKCDIVSRDQD